MKLVYMWIEDFRGMTNLGLNFYHKFRFEFDGKDKLNFKLINNTNYVDKYYPTNEYYNILVGKNGSGKSSVLDLLYNGVNDTKKYNKFFAIFFDSENNEFSYYGIKLEKPIKEGVNNVSIKNIHFDKIPLNFLDIRNYSNIYKQLNSTNDIFQEKLLISDDVKQNECLNKILNRLKNILAPENLKFFSDTVYKNLQTCMRHEFFKKFLLNYYFYKKLQYLDKEIQLPKFFYMKLNFPSKKYYENIFQDIKNDYPKIYNAILKLYHYVVYNDKLDFFEKIKIFYFIYMCEKYIYFSTNKNIFIETLQQIRFVDVVNALKKNFINNFVETILQNSRNKLIFNPFNEFLILNDFILGIKNSKYKNLSNVLVFNLEEQSKYIHNIIGNVSSYEQIFILGQNYIEFDFDPLLSSGHKQIFKIFNYILEGIKKLENKMDSYSRDILLTLDEPDNNLHYEWQRNFIKWLSIFLSQFEDINFQVLITTHSAFMLSDIPKENIIALDKRDTKKLQNSTLAQNLFVLLNDEFFIDSFLGGYVTEKLKEILKKSKLSKEDEELIASIGEEIIRKSLMSKIKAKK